MDNPKIIEVEYARRISNTKFLEFKKAKNAKRQSLLGYGAIWSFSLFMLFGFVSGFIPILQPVIIQNAFGIPLVTVMSFTITGTLGAWLDGWLLERCHPGDAVPKLPWTFIGVATGIYIAGLVVLPWLEN